MTEKLLAPSSAELEKINARYINRWIETEFEYQYGILRKAVYPPGFEHAIVVHDLPKPTQATPQKGK